MSSTSYIRIKTPDSVEMDQLSGFKHSFAQQFVEAGGKIGASIVKMGTDDFNSRAKPLLAIKIDGTLTPRQQTLVARYA